MTIFTIIKIVTLILILIWWFNSRSKKYLILFGYFSIFFLSELWDFIKKYFDTDLRVNMLIRLFLLLIFIFVGLRIYKLIRKI